MKYSKYNVFSEDKMLMFNTLNLSMAQLNEAQMNAFSKQDETFLSSIDMTILEQFKENGFIICDNASEIIFLKDKYWRSRYDRSTLNLSILTTKDCNFCCSYCFEVREAHSTMMLDDQQRIIKFIAKAAEQYSSININWYGGEPLLNIEAIRNISKATMQLL